MKEVEVLGSGCTKCVKTAELIEAVAKECGVSVHVVKQTSPEIMLKYGVMRTPAVVVDSQLMHAGAVPDRDTVAGWLTS